MNLQLIQFALQEYGVREVAGAASNPEIMEMARECGFTDYTNDDIAWCSLFLNYVALKALFERSKALNARSWLLVGEPVTQPELGDVVVFWREDPKGALGHVAFWIATRDNLIYALGGNESNQVMIAGFDPGKVLGFRRLSAAV